MNIRVSYEEQRGCGFRKPGGLYLISGRAVQSCCQLPFPLRVCKACGGGIKPSRGWTWINPRSLFFLKPCTDFHLGKTCLLSSKETVPEQAGLLWVGGMYYKQPAQFVKEAIQQGISRRIARIPNGFEVGKTFVFLAHQKAVSGKPGVFGLFLPERIEYVVSKDDSRDKLERLLKRGVELVNVKPIQSKLFE
jgi:hypothetical protein